MSDRGGPAPPAPFAEWERALSAGSFEEVFATLEAVVAHLEEGRLPLEHSVSSYEIGVRLAERCERLLAEAELRVSRLDEPSVAFEFDGADEGLDDGEE